ncbi:MAG: thiamine-phosphate kinase [Candidatus Aminicenantes bacterium]|nr:thiamine-phosphate kinase [Candidatus Aminicenantes bacterium]
MKFSRLTEKTLIDQIKKEFDSSKPGLIQGIGDDAAVVEIGPKKFILTKDLLIEGTHFDKKSHPPFLLGRKSLNVNLSDIAAMGGTPMYSLLGLSLPESIPPKWAEEFMAGIQSACREFDVALIGGDISQSRIISISVTVVGEGTHIIKRDGACSGDGIYISGTLGDSAQGLKLSTKGVRLGDDNNTDVLLTAFFDPSPQVKLGQRISENQVASSLIDVSDGLSVDLNHICEQSRVGAEIFAEKIPVSDELKVLRDDDMAACLHGGEDYNLLFTVSEQKKSRLESLKKEYEISEIGQVFKGSGVFLVHKDGTRERLKPQGYQHFSD